MSNTNPSIPDMLSTLISSLTSSLSSLPDPSAIRPLPSSFSLLSTKNELFLTYLQNLTLLIISNLRKSSLGHSEGLPKAKARGKEKGDKPERELNRQTSRDNTAVDDEKDKEKSHSSESDLRDAVVENLVGLRVYLEKGVRPLEGRLKYQLDKLLLAAADHARESESANHHHHQSNSRNNQTADYEDEDEDENDPNTLQTSSIPPLAHRPNPSALVRPSSSTNHTTHPTTSTTKSTTAPYRPPRINPTLPPTTDSTKATLKRAPRRSRAVDAFIREEMGDAPVAELSIGAGASAGRRGGGGGGGAAEDVGSREAERARERKEWEETRLVRLPGETKKRRRGAGAGGAEDIMAGMDWGLMHGGDEDRRGEERDRKRHKKAKGKSVKSKAGRSKGRK